MTFRQKSQEQSSVRIQTSVWSIASSFCLEFLLRRTLSLKFVLGHLMLWVGFREQSPSGGNKARCSSSMASAVCFRGHWGVQTSLCREFKCVCIVIHCFFRCLEGEVKSSRQAVQPAVLLPFTSFLRSHVWSLSELGQPCSPRRDSALSDGRSWRQPCKQWPGDCSLQTQASRREHSQGMFVTVWSRSVTGWLCFSFLFSSPEC